MIDLMCQGQCSFFNLHFKDSPFAHKNIEKGQRKKDKKSLEKYEQT